MQSCCLLQISKTTLNDRKSAYNVQSDIMVDILKKSYALTNIAPTILDLAGIIKPDIMKEESLLPLLNKVKL